MSRKRETETFKERKVHGREKPVEKRAEMQAWIGMNREIQALMTIPLTHYTIVTPFKS